MSAAEIMEIMREYRRLRALVPAACVQRSIEYGRVQEMLDAILDKIGEEGNASHGGTF